MSTTGFHFVIFLSSLLSLSSLLIVLFAQLQNSVRRYLSQSEELSPQGNSQNRCPHVSCFRHLQRKHTGINRLATRAFLDKSTCHLSKLKPNNVSVSKLLAILIGGQILIIATILGLLRKTNTHTHGY